MFSADETNTVTLSLPTVDTSQLGNEVGTLSQLASGGDFNLSSDNLIAASEIVNAARSKINISRVEVGAFDKYTIESSRTMLGDAMANMSKAVSLISDADIASESARYVRSQILENSAIASVRMASERQGLARLMFDEI